MSISTGSILRATQKYPNLKIEDVVLIGWGAGQFFRDYYPLISAEISLEFTLCPNEENHGKEIHGIKVYSPEKLNFISYPILIVIFSSASALIMNQIRDQFGDIPTVKALELNSNEALSYQIDGFFNAYETLSFQQKKKFDYKNGIFVQGLIYEYTPQILAWNKMHNPDAFQCMVTWNNQPTELIEKCLPWLDHIELIEEPVNLGPLFFNAILRACRIGAECLSKKGIEYAIRTRSDQVLVGSVHGILNKYFYNNRNNKKIGISLNYNWQNMPFMFSDRIMIGKTDVLLDAWSMDEFTHNSYWDDFFIKNKDNDFLSLREMIPETLFWTCVARRLGYKVETLRDSFNFAKDRLVIIEPEISVRSIKWTYLFDVKYDNSISFNVESWDRIFHNMDEALSRANAIECRKFTVNDFLSNKIG